jgi:hypothetical protein
MTASDIVRAVTDALNRCHAKKVPRLSHPPSAYVTAVLVPAGGPVAVDRAELEALGVRSIRQVDAVWGGAEGDVAAFDPDALVAAINQILSEHLS